MKSWQVLKPGDLIDIIAPGYPCTEEDLQNGVREIESWGFRVRFDKKILSPDSFHANTDHERFRQLKNALTNRQSNAVWCLRGGYGSNRLLPMIAKLTKPTQAKLFIGLSDITSLHVFLNQKWNWATIHGPLVDRIGKKQITSEYKEELIQLLSGLSDSISFAKLAAMNSSALKVKSLSGRIVGGNLTVLQSSIGTPFAIKLKNKFLFLEELGERVYRIDRMLEQFHQTGLFDQCQGILLGDFTGGEELNGTNRVWEALDRFADLHSLPLWKGIQSGHGAIQRPLPLNVDARLTRDGKSFELIVQSGSKK